MIDYNSLTKSIRDLESRMGNRVGPGNGVANIFGNTFGGGYTVPTTDPTFTSGLNYAKSIAGGQNVPNMISPGVSYSSERPQGYTAFTDNTPVAGPITGPTPPPVTGPTPPPVTGPTPPFGPPVSTPPPVNLPGPPNGSPFPIDFGGIDFNDLFPIPFPGMGDLGPINFGNKQPEIDYDKLYDTVISNMDIPDFSTFATKDDLNKGIGGIDIPTIDTTQFVTKDNLPTFNPYDFRDDFLSIAQDGINVPTYDDTELRDLINKNTTGINNIPTFDDSQLRDDINSRFETFTPDLSNFATKDDLYRGIDGIDIPTYEAPDLSNFVTVDDFNTGIGGVKMTGREELENALGNIPTYDDSAIINLINQNKESIDSIPGSINMPDLSGYATMDDLNNFRDLIPEPVQTYPMPDPVLFDGTPKNIIGRPINTPGEQDRFINDGFITPGIEPSQLIQGPVDMNTGVEFVPGVPGMSIDYIGSDRQPGLDTTPQETAKISSQQELLNLMSNKNELSQIPADDGVRNQYQVELDEYINKSPINMDTYKEELPIGSAINLGIPAVMETVVPMAVPGLGLAKNISNSLQSNNNSSSVSRPSTPSVSRPNYSHSQVSKFGR